MNTLIEYANAFSNSGFGSPQACLVKILFGREIGLPPAIAVSEIDLIPSKAGVKAALNARTQVAMIRRRGLGDVRFVHVDDDGAQVEAWRADDERRLTFTFTREEARKADLLGKDNYRKWPQSMFIARALAKANHALFQEVFLGLAYTPDELGANTDENGRLLTLAETADTGVKRKASPLTPTVVQEATSEVAQAMHTPPPEPPPPVTDADDVTPAALLRNQIKTLAAKLLKLTKDEWEKIRPRFASDDSHELTIDELQRLKGYLSNLYLIRWAAGDLHIPADALQKVLQRRGATQDTELSEAAAAELAVKLAEKLTPFRRNLACETLAQALGITMTPEASTGGNGSRPAAAVSAPSTN